MGGAPPSPGISGDALGQGPQGAHCHPSEHLLCSTTGTTDRGCRFSLAQRGALGIAGCFPATCPGVTPLHREATSAAGPVGMSRRRPAGGAAAVLPRSPGSPSSGSGGDGGGGRERRRSRRDAPAPLAPGAAAVPPGCPGRRGGGQRWLTGGAGAVLGVHVYLSVCPRSEGQHGLAGLAAAAIYGRPGGSGRKASAPRSLRTARRGACPGRC